MTRKKKLLFQNKPTLSDEVQKIIASDIATEKITASGGICAPVGMVTFKPVTTSTHVTPTILDHSPPTPCPCLSRVVTTSGSKQQFAIPVVTHDDVPADIRNKLLETTCTRCGQVYLIADWDDLFTGLLLK